MTVWRWMMIGWLFLLGCTAVPDPAPTPVQNMAEVATVVVKRPSATPLPTLTATPQPTATPALVVTDEMPRATAVPTVTHVPTFTSTPSPTPDPHLSVISSSELNELLYPISESEGQRPFVQDGILVREITHGSGEFEELGRYLRTAEWSPDGRHLLYSQSNLPNAPDNPDALFEYWLWSVADNSNSQLITNNPNLPYDILDVFWSPDGTKALLRTHPDERHDDIIRYPTDWLLVAADLSRGTLSNNLIADIKEEPVWFTNEVYVLRFHCGSPCATYRAYTYSNELAWEFDWRTGGFVDFASGGNFMINVGRGHPDVRIGEPPLPATVDEIDLTTGELKIIWERPREEGYFNPFFMPELSPDEQYIAFNYGNLRTVYMIGRNGQEYWQYANSHVVDWRPNNELTVCEMLDSGGSQLVHIDLAGEAEIIFSTEPETEISHCSGGRNGGGKWSPDGRYFIFTTENQSEFKYELYLWLPESDEAHLIYSVFGNNRFNSFNWLPDSTGFYFTWLQDNTIWFYQLETAD